MSRVDDDLSILKRYLVESPLWRNYMMLPIIGLSAVAGNVIESVTGTPRPYIKYLDISREDLQRVISILEVIEGGD